MTFSVNSMAMQSSRSAAVRLSLYLTLASAAGCGEDEPPPVGRVSGVVTFNDQPLPEGAIYAYNRSSAHAGEGEIHDGSFELLTELQTGTYVVFVTPIPPPPGTDQPKEQKWGRFPRNIPEKYQQQDKSDLTIEVAEGHNEVKLAIPCR